MVRDVLAVLPTGLGKCAMYVSINVFKLIRFIRKQVTSADTFPKFPSMIHFIDLDQIEMHDITAC